MADSPDPMVVPNDQPAAPEQPRIVEPKYGFYETDEKLTLEIFDKGANPDEVKIDLKPRAFTYENGASKRLALQPLRGEIDADVKDYSVGKVKIEVRLVKRVQGRWGGLVGDQPDILAATPFPASPSPPVAQETSTRPKPKKNWDSITNTILSSENDKSLNEDPNAGGDAAVNGFFQQLYGNADEDTRRAMMKSYIESNGTTLSTNWADVSKGKVEGKAPEGSIMKKWDS